MQIAVIGTGNVGRVLGRRWSEGGHDVIFGSRDPTGQDAIDLAASTGAEVRTQAEAAAEADVVLLAVPGPVALRVTEELGDLSGKIVVDCTNRRNVDLTAEPGPPSLAERIAQVAPGARVVKAFNTTGARNMDDPSYPSGPLSMPYCGDDADAKAVVRELITELGFEPVDNGPLSQAHGLEGMALVWICQAYGQGWGVDFGFVFARR